jgi:hypothetical protein
MSGMTYLHIRGTLAENMVYRPRPGYESARPERRSEGNAEFKLVLLDSEDRELLSVAPEVISRGCGTANAPRRYRVRGSLPLHPEGVVYELRHGEVRLYRASVASAPPALEAPRCHASANGITLNWEPVTQRGSKHPCGPQGTTYGVVAVMESGKRITLARGLTAPGYAVDMSRMPVAGKGMLHVAASDGVRSTEVEAGPIDVPARPPTVHILMPEADARLPFGQPVSVLGCCLDMGGQPCSTEEIVWWLDGERVAEGTLMAALDGIQAGTHELTLAHNGGQGYSIKSTIQFVIEDADGDYREWEGLMTAQPAEDLPKKDCDGLS